MRWWQACPELRAQRPHEQIFQNSDRRIAGVGDGLRLDLLPKRTRSGPRIETVAHVEGAIIMAAREDKE
jgi:hypothetical protein